MRALYTWDFRPVLLSGPLQCSCLGLKYQRVESGVSRVAEIEGGDPGRDLVYPKFGDNCPEIPG